MSKICRMDRGPSAAHGFAEGKLLFALFWAAANWREIDPALSSTFWCVSVPPWLNRVQKVLEKRQYQLASVATDVLGVSGRAMLEAILQGHKQPNGNG